MLDLSIYLSKTEVLNENQIFKTSPIENWFSGTHIGMDAHTGFALMSVSNLERFSFSEI